MEESKNEPQQSNEFECKFCQHYMCRILWSYIALCAIAVGGYFVLVSWLGVTDESTKATIAIGLIAWTAAMIVPLAAYFAITDWREQQIALKLSEHADQLIKDINKLNEVLELAGERSKILEVEVNQNGSLEPMVEYLNKKYYEIDEMVLDIFALELNCTNQTKFFNRLTGDKHLEIVFSEYFKKVNYCYKVIVKRHEYLKLTLESKVRHLSEIEKYTKETGNFGDDAIIPKLLDYLMYKVDAKL